MFSENNVMTNEPRDLAHYSTLLIDLTLEEQLQMWAKDEGVCSQVAFAIPAISLK